MIKPDDRSDNAQKIKETINNTKQNIKETNKTIKQTENQDTIHSLQAKNERREQAIPALKQEMKEELAFQRKQD